MARSRNRSKQHSGLSFAALPHAYFTSPEYAQLSPRAVKLLLDLCMQFRGNNNGDLSTAWRVVHPLGWRSKDQLRKALDELLTRGWLLVTRQGGRRYPTLFALSFLKIDACGGKLDVSPTHAPPNTWRNPKADVVPLVTAKSLARTAGHLGPQDGAVTAQEIGTLTRRAGQ
jgi:hypothetical protein